MNNYYLKNIFQFSIVIIGVLGLSQISYAQKRMPDIKEVDVLMANTALQLEITEGIDAMYNFNFVEADAQFRWLRDLYTNHPLPYFLLGLSQWWRIMPNIDNPNYDEAFFSYMDSSILMSERLLKKEEENIEAYFFLAGAYAFKARLNGERYNWTKGAAYTKRALNYFEKCKNRKDENISTELLFGDGLFNYYVEWIKDNYKALRAIMWLFDDGDKELGIAQLEETASEAFYTRIEAMYYLMRIHSSSDGNMQKAIQLSEYLYSHYPNNPYFHRYYARILYVSGQYSKMAKVSLAMMDRIEEGWEGYEETSGRYGGYFLGMYYGDYLRDHEKGKKYYQKAVEYSEKAGAYEYGYYLYSLRSLARYAKEEKNYEDAKYYYAKLEEHADNKKTLKKEAKKFRKEVKKLERKGN